MGKMLVVVDSEDKIAALQSQLDGDPELFVVAAPPLKVSLKPCPPGQQCAKGKFSFSFSPLESAKPLLAKLRQYIGKDIYLAFGCDSRGEFMSWLVSKAMEVVSPGAPPLRRLHLLALHAEELRQSFRLVEPIREDLAIGYHDRAVFDVALGKHIQRILGTKTGPAAVPLSTACLTTLFHLTERESEVRMHAARPRQRLRVNLGGKGEVFLASLVYAFGVTDDGDLYGVKDVEAAVRLLQDVEFVVDKIEKSELTVPPPAPYRLVELLEDAFILHHIPLAKTMAVVQQLFAGVDVDGVPFGLVTTHTAIGVSLDNTVSAIRQAAERQLGENQLSSAASLPVGEGFLLPTYPDLDGERLREVLGEEGCFIYEQIRRRALASQMLPAVGERFEVAIKAGEHCFFKAAGSVITVHGHFAVYQGWQDRHLLESSPLHGLVEGEALTVEQIVPEPVEATVAQFYNLESLFADLADFSIEPSPVIVTMLQQLIDGQYVEILPNGELRCRENAHKVVSTFVRAFPSMPGINLSAYLEQTISEVLSGRKALGSALLQFDQTMVMKGNVLRKVSIPNKLQTQLRRKRKSKGIIKGGGAVPPPVPPSVASPAASEPSPPAEVEVKGEPVAEPLPVPESVQQVTGEGVAPEIVGEEIPAETVTVSQDIAVAPEPISADEPVVGGEGEEIPAPEEEVSSVDLALEGLDEAAVAESELVTAEEEREVSEIFDEAAQAADVASALPPPIPSVRGDEKESGMACPVCRKGQVLHKKTPTGKPFYVCPREECEFMAWALPHPLPCQVCGSSFLVEKKDLRGHLFLRCPKAGCNYRQPMPGDDGAALLACEQEGVKKKKVLVRRVAKGSGSGGKKRKVLVRRRK